jgi:NTE family protein
MKNKKIALVLSSGGARGMAHIGVIEELLERGYEITSVAGSSIGSVVGGAYASGGLEKYKEWICSFEKIDILRLMDFTVSKRGFIRGEKVLNAMKDIFPDRNIQDLDIPLTILATDITNHREVVYESGSLYEAIRASIAIPSVMAPYQQKDIEIVDGGIINPFPLDRVKRQENDIIVGVNLNYPGPYESPEKSLRLKENEESKYRRIREFINGHWPGFFNHKEEKKHRQMGFFDLITSSMWVLQEKVTDLYIKQYHPEVVVNISRYSSDTFGFYRAKELINYGRKQAIRVMDEYEATQLTEK